MVKLNRELMKHSHASKQMGLLSRETAFLNTSRRIWRSCVRAPKAGRLNLLHGERWQAVTSYISRHLAQLLLLPKDNSRNSLQHSPLNWIWVACRLSRARIFRCCCRASIDARDWLDPVANQQLE